MVAALGLLGSSAVIALANSDVFSDESGLLSLHGSAVVDLSGEVAAEEHAASVQGLLELLAMGGGPRKAVAMLQELAGQAVLDGEAADIDDVTRQALESMNKTLVDVSQKIILNNHESDQRFLNEHAEMVGKCGDTFDEDKKQDAELGLQVHEREEQHRKCRMDLMDLIEISYSQDKCAELTDFMQHLTSPSCTVPRTAKDMDNWFMGLDRWVSSHWPKFNELVNGCKEHEQDRVNKDQLCDEKQHAFEQGFCTWRAAVMSTCSDYVSCYDRAVDLFQSSKNNVLENEASRKIDWGSIKKIKCYIGVMLSNETNIERLQQYNKCNMLMPSTDHLNIDVPGYKARRTCDLSRVADHPCTSDFAERYSQMPDTIQCLPCAPLPAHMRFDSMCVENLRLDDDNVNWSVDKQKPWLGSSFHGPFSASDVLVKSSYKLTPGAHFDIGVHLDTYNVFGNELCTIRIQGESDEQTQNVQTPQGSCEGSWEEVEVDGSGVSAFGLTNETNCMKRVKFDNRKVPEDGILTVEMQCPLQRGSWGFHNFFWQASTCPTYGPGR